MKNRSAKIMVECCVLMMSVVLSDTSSHAQVVNFAESRLNGIRVLSKERQALRVEREADLARLQEVRELRRWAVGQFKDVRVVDPGPVGSVRADRLDRQKRVNSLVAQRFVDLPPDYSRNNVVSGKALNFFLDVLGDTALQHDQLAKYLESQKADLEQKQDGVGGRFTEQDAAQLQWITARQALLHDILWDCAVSPSVLEGVYAEYGLSGPKLRIRLTQQPGESYTPLPLDWPSYLQRDDTFTENLKTIETARDLYLKSASGSDEAHAAMSQLMAGVDELDELFTQQRRETFDKIKKRGSTRFAPNLPVGLQPYHVLAAEKFVRSLRYGTTRLLESRTVLPPEAGPITPLVNGQYSIVEIMAHMRNSGLHFASSAPDTEHQYAQMFHSCREYYRRILAFGIAEQEAQRELDYTEGEIDEISSELNNLTEPQHTFLTFFNFGW